MLQVLLYPVTDPSSKRPSRELFSEGFLLTDRQMDFYERCYLPDPATRSAPRAAPLLAPDLSGAPPAYIAVAGHDVLRDDGIAYARALEAAGVPVTLREFDDMAHGFLRWGGVVDRARELVSELGAHAREALRT